MGDMEPIISMMTTGLKVQLEGQVMRAVQEAGVYVDKERLIKALEDARTYWEEGYRAALADRPHGRWFEMVELVEDGHTGEYLEELFYNCTNCDCVSEQKTPFCPWCGATMDLKEEE